MSVPYPIGSSGTTDPITNAYVVAPKDSEDFPYCPRVLTLGAAINFEVDKGLPPIATRMEQTATLASVAAQLAAAAAP